LYPIENLNGSIAPRARPWHGSAATALPLIDAEQPTGWADKSPLGARVDCTKSCHLPNKVAGHGFISQRRGLIDVDRLDYTPRLGRERIHLLLIDDAQRGCGEPVVTFKTGTGTMTMVDSAKLRLETAPPAIDGGFQRLGAVHSHDKLRCCTYTQAASAPPSAHAAASNSNHPPR
jgi:hypothetical protein